MLLQNCKECHHHQIAIYHLLLPQLSNFFLKVVFPSIIFANYSVHQEDFQYFFSNLLKFALALIFFFTTLLLNPQDFPKDLHRYLHFKILPRLYQTLFKYLLLSQNLTQQSWFYSLESSFPNAGLTCYHPFYWALA